MTKPAVKAKAGNDLELSTQGDGNSVDLKEGQSEYVKGKIDKSAGIQGAGQEILVNALDYTSKGDNQDIEIMLPGNKKIYVPKKYITGVELNEYGVYNSETDVNNNVKTKENVPSLENKIVASVIERVKETIGSLGEIRQSVEKETSISFDSIDIAVHELSTYISSLEEELGNLAKTNVE